MKDETKINKIRQQAKALAEANQLTYIIYRYLNKFDFCSLPEWDLVFYALDGCKKIETVKPAEKTDYNTQLTKAELYCKNSLFFHEMIEFAPGQWTYKLHKKPLL